MIGGRHDESKVVEAALRRDFELGQVDVREHLPFGLA